MKRIFFIAFISSFCLFLLINPALACGPFFPTYYHTPDDLSGVHNLNIDFKNSYLKIDSSGQIIFENLESQYLYPFYKKMVKQPLSASVKQALYFYDPAVLAWTDTELSDAIKQWKDVRNKFLNRNPEIEEYGNCFPDAFKNAAKTLKNRQKLYSKDQILEWIKNQDSVFAQCYQSTDKALQIISPSATVAVASKDESIGFF